MTSNIPRRRVWTTVAAVVCLSVCADGAGEPEWLTRLKTWSDAVDRHQPGVADAAVLQVAAWSASDVKTVVTDFFELRKAVRAAQRAALRRSTPAKWVKGSIVYKDVRVWEGDLQALSAFKEVGADGGNRTLRRAAMLHADVAMLAPLDRSTKTGDPDSVTVVDGVVVGYESQSAHWGAGRQLLDAIEPAPAADPFVPLWYNAIAATLLGTSNLAAARPHLEHAADVLPGNANIQYEIGCYHQAGAAPIMDAARRMMQRTQAGKGGAAPEESTDDHWKAAERSFREAVVFDPAHVEARTRLGAVLLERGLIDEAASQLRLAAASAADDVLWYFAQLLLGQAEERLGRTDAAAACYAAAQSRFPAARSPRFALAALARARGDREQAWQPVAALIGPHAPAQNVADPWWGFIQWQQKPAKRLLAELRARAAEDRPR